MPEETMTRDELVALIRREAAAQGAPAPASDQIAVIRDAAAEAAAKAIEPLLASSNATLKEIREAQAEREASPRLGVGRKVRLYALGTMDEHGKSFGGRNRSGDLDYLKYQATRCWGDHAKEAVKFIDYQSKTTHTVHDAAVAGDIVQPAYSPEWIELLRPKTVVRSIAQSEPMPRGSLSVRKQTGDATAYYQGENTAATQSNITVGRENMSYKKLVALCVLSNDLIRFGGPEADQRVEASMVAAHAQREDRAFLMGNPPVDQGSPKGIVFWTNSGNRFANAGVALTNFQSDVGIAASYIESNDVDPDGNVLIMNPTTWWKILALTTVTADTAWAATVSGGQRRFMGIPVISTSQLNETRSWCTSAFETELSQTYAGAILLVNGPSCTVYDSYNLTTAVYPGGAYYDASAAAVTSGISNDETVITAISEHDFMMKNDRAAAVIMNYNL